MLADLRTGIYRRASSILSLSIGEPENGEAARLGT
jgi:hypothetical protein